MTRLLHQLRGDERGVSIVEFALIAAPLMLILLGLVDLGFQQYIAMQLQGSLDEAARDVTVGGVSTSQIQALVTRRVQSVWPNATVTLTPKSFNDFSTVGKPEPITTDVNGNQSVDAGDCFLDVNGNGKWDSKTNLGAAGTGGGDDIVYYTATASYPEIMPMFAFIGWSNPTIVTGTMMMRNQPYAAQAQPKTVCL